MTDLLYLIACYWNLVVPGCKTLGTLFIDTCSEKIMKLAIKPIDEEIDNSLAF